MAKVKDGTSSAYRAAKTVCRLWAKYGTAAMTVKLGAPFAAAFEALAVACVAVELLDDEPLTIDTHAPFGAEDVQG